MPCWRGNVRDDFGCGKRMRPVYNRICATDLGDNTEPRKGPYPARQRLRLQGATWLGKSGLPLAKFDVAHFPGKYRYVKEFRLVCSVNNGDWGELTL